MPILLWIIQGAFVPLCSPLVIGVVRKIKAKFQKRQGASVFQPYKNLWKLFHKDEVESHDASWIFRCAPYLVFTVTIIVGASVPILSLVTKNPWTSDILLVVYLLALGTFFLALAGLDVGSSFGGFGSSREMMIALLAEGAMIFALFAAAFAAGSHNLFAIADVIQSQSPIVTLPLVFAFVGFLIVLLAENSRFPFDNPATHLELTMIHEAMILEYSGKRLALMEWAAANKLLIFMVLASNIFFPWGIATHTGIVTTLVGMIVVFGKILLLAASVATLESTTPKLRYFRLPNVLFTAFVLCVISLGLLL